MIFNHTTLNIRLQESCKVTTIIQVDNVNIHGILLEVVQVLTETNFIFRKLT
ncbi:hypothetical protein HanPI659440_Chr02g0043551 [Helianthus annuus]|nr:hypothetical protein HanPI659440_Chr02g0043551 [Helianthus annuus]